MSDTSARTPGPWRLNAECGNESIIDVNDNMIADCAIFFPDSRDSATRNRANAAFIVRACNQYDEHVALLRRAREELHLIRMKDSDAVYDPALRVALDDAIAQATEGGDPWNGC